MSREPPREQPCQSASGQGDPLAAKPGRVLVLSADFAARRALMLMLESHGFLAYPFASLDALLRVADSLGTESAGWCYLLMAERPRADRIGLQVLLPLRRDRRVIPAVILTWPVAAQVEPPVRHSLVWYADPLVPEDVLRSVRAALGNAAPG